MLSYVDIADKLNNSKIKIFTATMSDSEIYGQDAAAAESSEASEDSDDVSDF